MVLKALFRRGKIKIQHFSLLLCKKLLDRTPPVFNRPLTPENIGAILFLRQDGKIGDFIVSSFAFREIKTRYPHIRIGVVCSEKNRQLFVNQPYIDCIHEVKAKSKTSYYQTAKKLSGQYDVVIEPTQVFRLRDLILLRFLAAPFNIGLDKTNYRLFNLNITDMQQHYTDIYRNALQLCGFDDLNTQAMLPENSESRRKVQAFLAENHLTDYIAINFFAAPKSRRFSHNAIHSILAELTRVFPIRHFLLLTAPDTTAQLQSAIAPFDRCYIYRATQTIDDSIELIRHAAAVITPDTAIVHIAAALDKKIIGLYQENPQSLANWHPKAKQVNLLFFRQHIDEISPQQIAAALNQIIEAASAPST